MKFIDFHCHPSRKPFLTHHKAEKKADCWHPLVDHPIKSLLCDEVLNSQSSFDQLKSGSVNLVIVPISALERALAKKSILWKLQDYIFPFKKKFIRKIADKRFSYNELFIAELNHLFQSANCSDGRQFKIIKGMEEYEEDSDQLHIILAAEGGHNFYGPPRKKYNEKRGIDKVETQAEIIFQNLQYFKEAKNPRLLFISPAHFSKNAFCSHAYSTPKSDKDVLKPDPKAIGFHANGLGKEFIRLALDEESGRRILIDVKHMSLKSRRDYYRFLREEFPEVPILASRSGFTGYSYRRVPIKEYKKDDDGLVKVEYGMVEGIKGTHFNPCSINLYNEEIEEIIRSQGLIGLSLDQKTMGIQSPEHEFFARSEFQLLLRPHIMKSEVIDQSSFYKEFEDLKDHDQDEDILKKIQLQYFFNQLIHYYEVAVKIAGPKTWDYICLSSDFDGWIDPIINCPAADQFPNFAKVLLEEFPRVAAENGIKLTNPEEVIQKILYTNALNFLKLNYSSSTEVYSDVAPEQLT